MNYYYDTNTYNRYSSASMNWTVPAAVSPPASQPKWVAVWPGIGVGGSTDQLIQAGTVSNSGPGGFFGGSYSGITAWFEVYPKQNMQTISNLTFSAGNKAQAIVSWDGSTAWFIVCNVTTNKCASANETVTASTVAADTSEWVVERPSLGGSLTQLSPFGTITVTNAIGALYQKSTNSSDSFTEGSGGNGVLFAESLNMMSCDFSTTLAQTGSIDTTGKFTVTWKNGGSVESC